MLTLIFPISIFLQLFLIQQNHQESAASCCGCCDSSSRKTIIAFMGGGGAPAYGPPAYGGGYGGGGYGGPGYGAAPYYSPSVFSFGGGCNYGCFRKRRDTEEGDLSEEERDKTMVSVKHRPNFTAENIPPAHHQPTVSPGISIGNGTYYFAKLRNESIFNSTHAQVFDNTLGLGSANRLWTSTTNGPDLGYVNVTERNLKLRDVDGLDSNNTFSRAPGCTCGAVCKCPNCGTIGFNSGLECGEEGCCRCGNCSSILDRINTNSSMEEETTTGIPQTTTRIPQIDGENLAIES